MRTAFVIKMNFWHQICVAGFHYWYLKQQKEIWYRLLLLNIFLTIFVYMTMSLILSALKYWCKFCFCLFSWNSRHIPGRLKSVISDAPFSLAYADCVICVFQSCSSSARLRNWIWVINGCELKCAMQEFYVADQCYVCVSTIKLTL